MPFPKRLRTNRALEAAKRLPEIGFPEFTAKLITGVFDAINKSNVSQIENYVALLSATSKNLTEYINETKDGIDGEEIINFLLDIGIAENKLEAIDEKESDQTLDSIDNADRLDGTDVDAINTNAVTTISNEYTDNNPVNSIELNSTVAALRDAIAIRIAQSKYSLLREMVSMGLVRTVVDKGTIETKLMFETWDITDSKYNFHKRKTSKGGFSGKISGKVGGLLSKVGFGVGAGIGGGLSKLTVTTVNARNVANVGTDIDIFGSVKIDFSTDYLPLKPVE